MTATATDQPGTTAGATTARNATNKTTADFSPASALQQSNCIHLMEQPHTQRP